MSGKINTAVILAAGNGARLSGGDASKAPSKPLTRVAGLPLIARTMLTLKEEGIDNFVVVTGYKGEQVEEYIQSQRSGRLQGLNIQTVRNERWKSSNGLSVLAAQPLIKSDFLLTMSDHVFQKEMARTLLKSRRIPDGAILAVDRKIKDIFDLDDATKVLVDNSDRIVDIGKELPAYNCIDTGLFKCTTGLFDALEQAKLERGGDCSLSDGIKRLAGDGKMGTCDIGSAWWQDVDTPGALHFAEKMLFNSCRKPVDGIVARYINRNISLSISRMLVNKPVTPNFMSIITFTLGVLAALAVTQGTYWWFLAGAILMQANSILDGVDGELARVRFQKSRLGEWLDTISDDLSNILFFTGLAVGASRMEIGGGSHYLVLGMIAVVGLFFSSMIFYKEIFDKKSGDLYSIDWSFDNKSESVEKPGLFTTLVSWLRYTMKKDFFIALFLVMAILGILPWALYLGAGGGIAILVAAVARKLKRKNYQTASTATTAAATATATATAGVSESSSSNLSVA